ncbi:MAG: D-alanine--D-alanine ligase [Clostridiales bacterium]|nr:D-alanine--D-alanine ligase [Clostridiales bacterium]
MKIVVLAGGLSAERDVSFKTGEMVTQALRENGHQVILLDVFMGYSDKKEELFGIFDRAEEVSVKAEGIREEAPDLQRIKAQRKDQSDNFFGPNVIELCRMADIVFLALHGENGENGKVQATFDLFGIRYTGSGYLSSALAMDKGRTKQLLQMAGIPTPRGFSVKKEEAIGKSPEELGISLPCVVKPCCGGSSIGVSIVRSKEEFSAALEAAFRWENELVLEEYVQGREFSVGVVDFEALPVIEIAPLEGFYDYKNKYKAGSAVETCPAELSAELTEQMQHYAVQVAKVLELDTYSRSDFLLSEKNEIFCLEANTLPGMTPTSLLPQEAKAAGMDFNRLCERLIEISLRKYEKQGEAK